MKHLKNTKNQKFLNKTDQKNKIKNTKNIQNEPNNVGSKSNQITKIDHCQEAKTMFFPRT
jgi:hypothetical protein